MIIAGIDFDYNLAAIAIYLVILCYYFLKKHIYNVHFVTFVGLIFSSILVPILEMQMVMATDQVTSFHFAAFWTTLFFLMRQISCFFFLMFIMSQLEMFSKMHRFLQGIVITPVIVMGITILMNPITKVVFYFTEEGEFVKGPFFGLAEFSAVIYYFLVLFYVIARKKSYKLALFFLIHVSVLMNVIAEVMRYHFSNLYIQSLFFAFSLLLLTIYMDRYDVELDMETGLAPRQYLEDIAKRYIHNDVPFDTILFRVADFDMLNTSYGVARVDKMLKEIGKFLFGYTRNGLAFQVDSDCFALVVIQNPDVNWLANNIYKQLRHNWLVNDIEIASEFYVTTVNYPEDVKNIETFNAFLQYFESMQRQHYGMFHTDELQVNDKVREQMVEKTIERALTDGNFQIYYQPICRTSDQRFIAAEALIRMEDPEMGWLNPSEFIPLAEDNGKIIPIGHFIVDSVCQFVEEENMEELGLDFIELNLSMVQCLQKDFIREIDHIVDSHRVLSKYICFEITETASNYSPALFADNVQRLADRGFALALDDFGTGYSNLQRLANSHYHVVKFDKEMTQQFAEDKHLEGVLASLVAMLHSIGSQVVAEGVETKEQYDFVVDAGVDYIQGYYFSRPVAKDDFITFLKEHYHPEKEKVEDVPDEKFVRNSSEKIEVLEDDSKKDVG